MSLQLWKIRAPHQLRRIVFTEVHSSGREHVRTHRNGPEARISGPIRRLNWARERLWWLSRHADGLEVPVRGIRVISLEHQPIQT